MINLIDICKIRRINSFSNKIGIYYEIYPTEILQLEHDWLNVKGWWYKHEKLLENRKKLWPLILTYHFYDTITIKITIKTCSASSLLLLLLRTIRVKVIIVTVVIVTIVAVVIVAVLISNFTINVILN